VAYVHDSMIASLDMVLAERRTLGGRPAAAELLDRAATIDTQSKICREILVRRHP